EPIDRQPSVRPEIVVLGTSTGGPRAVQEVLCQLPASLPAGLLIVQHMPPGFTAPFAKRLDTLCKLQVREARHGDLLEPGVVLIARAGSHATVARKSYACASVYLSEHPTATMHRPSVDVTMFSVAREFGRSAMGIIMTGMGCDGLEG